MAATLGPHSIAFLRPASSLSSLSDSVTAIHHDHDHALPPRFPHTRAQLAAIARLYKPDAFPDNDPDSFLSSSLIGRVVGLLDGECEDELKVLLKDMFGPIGDEDLEQHVLDLMHKHRDDIDNVPFLFLTPTRRPISRPSSRASTHSARLIPNRPDTPNSAPSSPLAMIFRRPHTPLTSPLGTLGQSSSYITARSESPGVSPIMTHAQFAVSLPSSPLSSPRLLNAKAHEFRPIPRPLSAASSNPSSFAALRGDTPSPDLWAPPSRPTSKLAIAAPLTPDISLLQRSATPNSSLRSSMRIDDEDDDPFDPFATRDLPRSFHPSSSEDMMWGNSPIAGSSLSADDSLFPQVFGSMDHNARSQEAPRQNQQEDVDPEFTAMLTDGMTPFDVLSSVFGATLAPSELEEALAANGYDFERAMSWLVDRSMASHPNPSQPRMQSVGNRVTLVQRDGNGVRGGRASFNGPQGRNGGRFVNGRPAQGGNRVCRYFLAGECLRADCRFSHDLERALCRFWLRGTCAKGENCEFLHHLPQEIDVNGLGHAMARVDIHNGSQEQAQSTSLEEFPTLGHSTAAGQQNDNRRGGYGYGRGDASSYDPSRTRFAAAVKKAPPNPQLQTPKDPATLAARREAMGASAEPLHPNTAIVAPKPSPRLKLHSPTLLPTLPTGESVNNLYMAYRQRALRLGAARNACLSRAADAWRRGDGAAAKRFSREGHDLNAKMAAEMVEAAGKLVRERARLAEQAVRGRDASWSDDPGDRTARGRIYGAGLGVCLGIASQSSSGDTKMTPEERTEVLLDLHGLHAAEATEVLEEFLLALERELFYGLSYIVVGEEKHTGTQDPARGASRMRLATGVREWLHMWGYPWSERDGVVCVDPLTHQ
ncbi:uncharacterized protein BXZ73DRAFT_45302 [Epithele typhae]|uniref:uncharacterized protein n=1 Tax=Epithele typhae TaxID=378194 RepID=UPI002008DBB2|nr:uncharacterized protein BXZ73DRAFT_45302 [Epithele typhae]KAH9935856.1 hypothetical protein BXZ73DRAFT_45302 [Epithele typhae]